MDPNKKPTYQELEKLIEELKSENKEKEERISLLLKSSEDNIERKKDEALIKEISERLLFATTASKIGVWEYGISDNSLIWDDQMYELYGITPETFSHTYDAWSSGLHPEDIYQAELVLNNSIKSGENFNTEFRVVWPDKSVHHIRAFAKVIFDESGKALKMIGANYDITQIKEKEIELSLAYEILQASEERLRLSTELGKVAVWEYNVLANEMSRSSNHDSLYGIVGQGKWHAETFLDATHPDDREYSNQIIQDSLAPGGPDEYNFDFRVFRPDGVMVWLNVIGQIIQRDVDNKGILIRGCLTDITENKKADAKVRESESNLISLFNNTQDSIWSLDLDYNYIIFNSTYAALFFRDHGFEVKKGMSGKKIVSPEMLKFWESIYEPVFAGEKNVFEYTHTIDGSLRYFQTSISPIYEDGEITGASAISVDISEVKLAQEDLIKAKEKAEENEAKFMEAFNSSPVALGIAKNDGIFIEVNDVFCKLTGYLPEEILGKTSINLELFSKEEQAKKLANANINGGTIKNLELQLKCKEGAFHDIIYSKGIILIDNVRHLLVTALDITERKRSVTALMENEKRLNNILQTSIDGFWRADWEGRLLEVNLAYCQMSGYSKQELLALSITNLEAAETPIETKAHLKKIRSLGKDQFESRHKRKDGTVFDVEISVQSNYGADDEMVVFIRDITERKKQSDKIIKSENKFRNLFNNSAFGIVICELIKDEAGKAIDFIIIDANSALEKHLGAKPEQIIGKFATQLVSKVDADYSVALFEKVVKTHIPVSYERFYSEFDKTLEIGAFYLEQNFFATTFIDITERIKSQEALHKSYEELQESSQRYKTLITASNTGAWEYYSKKDYLWCSDEYFTMLDRDEKDFNLEGNSNLKETWLDLLHPDDREPAKEKFSAYLKNSIGMYENHFRMKKKSGEWLWIWSRGKKIFNDVGEWTGKTVGTHINITEQKNAEEKYKTLFNLIEKKNEKLIDLHEALNQAQKLSNVGSWQWNMETDKAEWSDEMYNIYGVTKESFYPSNEDVTKTILPEDLSTVEKGIASLLVDKAFVPFEFRIQRPSGEIRHLYIQALEKKSKENIFGVTMDITERKKNEEEKLAVALKLEATSNELNEAQRLAKVGSWLFNGKTLKVDVSDEMYSIWGFDSKNGAPLYDEFLKRIHPNDLELHVSSVYKANSLGVPYDISFRINLPNNEQKVIKAICKPIFGNNGEVISLTGTNQDITDQKLFEEAQVKHQRIKAIGEMSSSIAHDFNNSLQQMLGNLEIIKLNKELSGSSLERLHNLETTINDVAGRVSALQRFGDTDFKDDNIQLVDFNILIKEVLNQSRPLWKDEMEKEELKVHIITDFAAIPKISCNSGELKSAIYNLIKNSIEAMPNGGDLIIKTGIKAERVFATFTDTGIGMDENVRSKIFEPFFTTKGFKLGRGLGMSGVYTIIKKYSGDIVVKSPGLSKGSTFEIDFPISQLEEIKVISKNEPIEKLPFNVLWVDDDSIITEDISELLELMGHKCTIANSGKNALEYLNKNTYDVVFTDIGMPDMNGWDLIAAIRNIYGNKIKIVTVTGWAVDDKTKEEHAIDFVLQKPFTLNNLEKLFLEL